MLIACVQSDVTFAEPRANLSRVIDWMNRAAAGSERKAHRPADLVVFPECMLTGYTFDSREHAEQAALTLDDPIFSALAEHAKQLAQVISLGFLQRCGKRLHNAAALIGPEGVVANYQKVHLPHLGVDRFVDPGRQPYRAQVLETPRGRTAKIGMAICYDASFPEPIRVLALDGAQIIALGTNWPVEATHTARIVPPARSMENHLYFVAANRVGRENDFTFCGRSSICGPDGVVLTSSGDDGETILFADADPALADNKRIERSPGVHTIDRFADRRPEFYDPLTRRLEA